jgi:transcriptional regulator with XRE-family HTH domain
MSSSTRISLGEYVRRLRRDKQWDLQELADHVDLSVSHLSRIENDRAVPNADSVIRLAKALDGDLGLMLELAEHLPREMLERLLRRVNGGGSAHRRAAGIEPDPTYARALVEDMDPSVRQAIAEYFAVPDQDVDGLASTVRQWATLDSADRQQVLDFIAFLVSRRGEERHG